MKKSNIPYFIFILINAAIALSCYFYPVTRDEFYYLDKINFPNPFEEYFFSYHFGNPRIGQFLSNVVSRNILLEVVFGLLLFNAFISVLFLNVYRKIPDFRKRKEMISYLSLAAVFIFSINYFGEMFYYTPYSTNYTFTTVFYLFYVFIISDYYLFGNEKMLTKLPYLGLVFFGIFMGMSNEHVPPILVGVSALFAFLYFIKVKKLPSFKVIILPISIVVGYAILFFAPANKIKQKVVGKSILDTELSDYLSSWIKIFKNYFYFNKELILLTAVVIVAILLWNNKIIKSIFSTKKIAFWGLLFILPLMIVAVSPLIGTRLLFFSSSVLIIVLYKIMIILLDSKKIKIPTVIVYGILLIYFGGSVFITFNANQNYEKLISEIEIQRKQTKEIELDHHLNYFNPNFGNYINRKILLESGENYLDQDASHDTPVERNLKVYFQLQSIKEK